MESESRGLLACLLHLTHVSDPINSLPGESTPSDHANEGCGIPHLRRCH